jgi:(p)ppGpp synthase/HD superfamily hydrolase
MATLERAIAIAVEAHTGQQDKSGQPYILHPLRVMMRVESEEGKIIAVLHDVVEDTDWSQDRLRAEGFSDRVLQGIEAVTKREGETYPDFIERAAVDRVFAEVKLADLEDNLDVRRLGSVSERDAQRINKYLQARTRLRAVLTAA